MRSKRSSLLVALAALAGIALAAAITLGTSQLVRQHIGLASEPLSAGRRLLPAPPSSTDVRADAGKHPAQRRAVSPPRRGSSPAPSRDPAATQVPGPSGCVVETRRLDAAPPSGSARAAHSPRSQQVAPAQRQRGPAGNEGGAAHGRSESGDEVAGNPRDD